MHRALALGLVLLFGCARAPSAPSLPLTPVAGTTAPASVDAGPPPCDRLHSHISGSESQLSSQVPTWLAAPVRMVESRRLRALQARSEDLGCPSPRS